MQDLARGLYESSYINFTSALSRPLLEEFAALVAKDGSAGSVEQVYDQYLDYIVLEPSLFSLLPASASSTSAAATAAPPAPKPNGSTPSDRTTYERLNDPKMGEREIEEETDRISRGLFSTLATMGEQTLVVRRPADLLVRADSLCAGPSLQVHCQ